jgi:hypothetical protein
MSADRTKNFHVTIAELALAGHVTKSGKPVRRNRDLAA